MRLLPVAAALILAGCANIDVQRVTKANTDSVHGIRYWRPAPYLYITGDKEGACTAKIIYLPDKSEEYVMTPHPGFGSITFKPSLQDGWNLTNLDSSMDSKTADLISAIAKITGVSKDNTAPHGLKPGIYKMKFDPEGNITLGTVGEFSGTTACATYKEPAPAPTPPPKQAPIPPQPR